MSCLQEVVTTSCLVVRRRHLFQTSWRRFKNVCVCWLLWNHTTVCKPGTLFGYWVVGVSFTLGVGKGLRQDKCRFVRMPYLSRGKISKLRRYQGNGEKSEKTKTKRSTCSFRSQLYQKNQWMLPNKREKDQPHILHMSKLKTTLGLSLYGNHETLRSIRERILHHCC